ncbi:MAG: hypothetical protein ACI89T_000847, partial [Cognaticolwellia sp.]
VSMFNIIESREMRGGEISENRNKGDFDLIMVK